MPGLQRIVVITGDAGPADVVRLAKVLGRDPVVLAAPTAEAVRVVHLLGVEPQVEGMLAPVSRSPADRGHRLDELVRRHAVRDRLRDVVVVTDPATATALLQVLAPGQSSSAGGVTVVGLPRGDRPVAVRRGLLLGLVLGVAEPLAPLLVLPGCAAGAGLVLLLVPPWRHVGRELLLAAAVAFLVVVLVVAGSQRFPGSW